MFSETQTQNHMSKSWIVFSETNQYQSELEEPDWSVRRRQEEEEKKARQSLIADEFKKRRGIRTTSSKVRCDSIPSNYSTPGTDTDRQLPRHTCL